MKNVLICYPKNAVKGWFETVMEKNPESFPDSYSWQITDVVTHVDDPYARFERQGDGKWHPEGGTVAFDSLSLSGIDIPKDTFVYFSRGQEKINPADYDEIISINDPDVYGVLEFAKFLEDNNVPVEKASVIPCYYFTSTGSMEGIEDKVPFAKAFEKTTSGIRTGDYGCPYNSAIRFERD